MTDDTNTEAARDRVIINAAEARAQASENGYGFLRSQFRRVKPTQKCPEGEVFEIPHKDLFDNDQQERWEDLQSELLTYDRHPDLKNKDGDVVVRGQLIIPHHKEGKRITPSWPERLAEVLWGKEGAKRAKAGGLNFNEIEMVWGKQDLEYRRRMRDDSKSADGDSGVESVAD